MEIGIVVVDNELPSHHFSTVSRRQEQTTRSERSAVAWVTKQRMKYCKSGQPVSPIYPGWVVSGGVFTKERLGNKDFSDPAR